MAEDQKYQRFCGHRLWMLSTHYWSSGVWFQIYSRDLSSFYIFKVQSRRVLDAVNALARAHLNVSKNIPRRKTVSKAAMATRSRLNGFLIFLRVRTAQATVLPNTPEGPSINDVRFEGGNLSRHIRGKLHTRRQNELYSDVW